MSINSSQIFAVNSPSIRTSSLTNINRHRAHRGVSCTRFVRSGAFAYARIAPFSFLEFVSKFDRNNLKKLYFSKANFPISRVLPFFSDCDNASFSLDERFLINKSINRADNFAILSVLSESYVYRGCAKRIRKVQRNIGHVNKIVRHFYLHS